MSAIISDVKKTIGHNDSNTVLLNFCEAFQWQNDYLQTQNLQFYQHFIYCDLMCLRIVALPFKGLTQTKKYWNNYFLSYSL